MDDVALFGRSSLNDYSNLLASALGKAAQDTVRQLQNWDPDALLTTPDEDLIDRLIQQGTVRCPRLLTDQAELLNPTEVEKESMDFGERYTRRVTRLVLAVPFDGRRDVFTLRADTSSFNPPRVLRLQDNELHLAVDDPPEDAARIRAQFDEQIAKIEQHLDWSRIQIDRHNQQIRSDVPKFVADRREQLLATRKLQSDTGYPTRGQR